MAKEGDLQVWWIPQVPGKPFMVPVESTGQAALVLDTLARYDAFQFENRIKPDYCNAGGLSVYESDEWTDWYDDEGRNIDELASATNDKGVHMSERDENGRYVPDEDEKRDAWEARRRIQNACRCSHLDMPGSCPGPANCPMCQDDSRD